MANTPLRFYTHPMSRGRIVRWMLEEAGVPYDTTVLEFAASMKSPEYLAINPMGKVPAILHGATVVTECAAICAYLADAFPAAGLAPELGARGDYYRWLFFAAGPLEQAVVNKALGVVVPPERRAMAGYGSLEDTLNTLELAVSGKTYLVGNRFSAADVYVGSQIGWGLQFGTLDKRPAFETYWKGLESRPAAVRAGQIDDALIPPRKPA
ncbi:MAG: glutathione S-transferase family protein [Panacagrimonas sp.]